MSLYGLDESTQRLLNLKTFQNDFSPKTFVEQLSRNHAGKGTVSEALDPKPYIRTFEAVLSELQRLQRSAKSSEEEAASWAQSAEIEHSKNVISLGRSIDNTVTDFGVLDGLIGDISGATSSLSDRLERLSFQHDQAIMSKFLIDCYLSFASQGNCPELSKLWEGSAADRRKCATVVRQLQSLSRRIGDSVNAKCQEQIDRYSETLERDLLTDFDNAYRAADLGAMKESADLLMDFNGGGSVIQIFVNQHDLFIMQEKLVDATHMEGNDLWIRMSNPDSGVTEFEDIIQDLIEEIKIVIATETDIIRKVFRDPVLVLKVFLQRIFAQKIQQQLEAYLSAAENVSMLACVRVLHILYSKVGLLIKSLKESLNSVDIDADGELASLLDQNFSDLFLPYIENGRYFDLERRNLQDIILATFVKFSASHVQKNSVRDQGGLLGRFTSTLDVNSTNSSRENGGDRSTSSEKGRFGQYMRAFRLERTSSHGKKIKESNEDEDRGILDSEIRFEDINKVLRAFAESVKRELELAPPGEVYQNAESLLQLLLETAGNSYIDMSLEDAVAGSFQDVKSDISLNYLGIITKASGATQLLGMFGKSVLLPMVSGSSSAQTKMVNSLNEYISKVEDKANSVVQNTVDLILDKLTFILSKQKKKDFLPRDERSTVQNETGVCSEIQVFLIGLYSISVQSLNGANLNAFIAEIGVGFKELLMEHLKKFTISSSGGLVLARDIQLYQEVIDGWNISELSEAFSILHGIGNLYTAEPQVLTSLLKESNLSQLKPYVIREYLSKRLDYYSNSINKLLSSQSMNGHSITSYVH